MRASEFVKTVKKALTPKKQPETGLPRDQVPDSRVIQTTAVGIQGNQYGRADRKGNREQRRDPAHAGQRARKRAEPEFSDPG